MEPEYTPTDRLRKSIDNANELQRQRSEIDRQIAANQMKIVALSNQGPAILDAVMNAVSGDLGGRIGLPARTAKPQALPARSGWLRRAVGWLAGRLGVSNGEA